MTARQRFFAPSAVRGGGGRRFAPVDIAVAHHEFNMEQKLSFTWDVAGKIFP